MTTKMASKRTPKKLVASFPLSFYALGRHVYDQTGKTIIRDKEGILSLGGEVGSFALGAQWRAGHLLIAHLAAMDIPLGTEVRVTMEPVRTRGRKAKWKRAQGDDDAISIRIE
jgi:hypothetical protein